MFVAQPLVKNWFKRVFFVRALCAISVVVLGPTLLRAAGPLLNVDTNDVGCSDVTGTPYCTIQAAIDDLPGGGEIVVAPGTYNESINFLGRAINLHSSGGPSVTIIDGGGAGTVVTCSAFEGPDTVLEGFTITGGSNTNAGGMQNTGSSPTVTDCVFDGNMATFGFGGGMFNEFGSAPTVTDCTFIGNTVFAGGGGMYNTDSSPTVTDCAFVDNTASGFGGGGMNNKDNSSPVVTACLFVGNTAQFGGGMGNEHSILTVRNCAFSGNTANSTGGGMWNNDSTPSITGCSFSGNTATLSTGGGIFNTGIAGSSPPITNCVLWGNNLDEIFNNGAGDTPTVSFSDVEGGIGAGSIDGGGNVDADPAFVDLDGADNTIGTEDDDLRLQGVSPCINSGDPGYVPQPGETDLDGNARVMGCGVDLGAFEFVQATPGPANSGDMDGVGGVDFPDVALFVDALLAGSDLCDTADMNDDGSINGDDTQLFLDALLHQSCTSENTCFVGHNCVSGFCEPTTDPDIEIGIGGGAICISGPYRRLQDGDVLPACEGIQGFFDTYWAFRAKGFTPGGVVSVERAIKMVGTTCTLPQDCGPGQTCVDGVCSPTSEFSSLLQMSADPDGNGIIEGFDFRTTIFDDVDGEEAIITATMTDQTDPQITASVEVTVFIFVKRICFGNTCDPGQQCINGYCESE